MEATLLGWLLGLLGLAIAGLVGGGLALLRKTEKQEASLASLKEASDKAFAHQEADSRAWRSNYHDRLAPLVDGYRDEQMRFQGAAEARIRQLEADVQRLRDGKRNGG